MEILLAKLNVCSEAVRRLHPAVDLLLTSGAVPRGRVVDAADGAHDKARRVLLAGLFHRGRNGSGDDGNQLVVVRLLDRLLRHGGGSSGSGRGGLLLARRGICYFYLRQAILLFSAKFQPLLDEEAYTPAWNSL